MRILTLLVGAAALFAVTAPAVAASRADWDACKGDDPDRSIAACTRIIQGRGETAKDSAIAHPERGLSYKSKGDFDRAIADFSEAIRFDPKYAEAYYLRGVVYGNKGDLDRAIAPTTARRSGSIPSWQPPTTTGATRTRTRATSTAPSPTSARRSGSLPSSKPPIRRRSFAALRTTTAEARMRTRATSTAPLPTSARRSGSIPSPPRPTIIEPARTGTKAISTALSPT